MGYTFELANRYAKKHGIQYRLSCANCMYDEDLKYYVDVADKYDGFCRSETYRIYYDNYYGYRFVRCFYGYAFKKDNALVERICNALNDDSFMRVCNKWLGDIDE